MSGLNKIEGLNQHVPVMSEGLEGRIATRPNVPNLCIKCKGVIVALQKAAVENPDATNLIANCAPLDESITADINVVAHGSGEGGSEKSSQYSTYCLVAEIESRGTGM